MKRQSTQKYAKKQSPVCDRTSLVCRHCGEPIVHSSEVRGIVTRWKLKELTDIIKMLRKEVGLDE